MTLTLTGSNAPLFEQDGFQSVKYHSNCLDIVDWMATPRAKTGFGTAMQICITYSASQAHLHSNALILISSGSTDIFIDVPTASKGQRVRTQQQRTSGASMHSGTSHATWAPTSHTKRSTSHRTNDGIDTAFLRGGGQAHSPVLRHIVSFRNRLPTNFVIDDESITFSNVIDATWDKRVNRRRRTSRRCIDPSMVIMSTISAANI